MSSFITGVTCHAPESILHGRVNGSLYTFGSTINYVCDKGYNLISNRRMRICLATGKWSLITVKCEGKIEWIFLINMVRKIFRTGYPTKRTIAITSIVI